MLTFSTGIIVAGCKSNYGEGKALSWVYCTGTLDAAIWGAELATGSGRERIYVVQPIGPVVDDPNLTDKKFTRHCRIAPAIPFSLLEKS